MKKVNFKTALIVLFVLLTAATSFAQTSAEYKTKIEAMNKQMAKYMLEGTGQNHLEIYAADAISLPSYEPIHDGLPAIKKAGEDMAKSGVKFTSYEPTVVKVLVNGNMITEIGTYKISMTMPGMDKPMDDHGKYLVIWEKQSDGSLKIKVETWNTDVMPTSMGDAGAPKTN
jgi:ketosteroid isomerase-like protein